MRKSAAQANAMTEYAIPLGIIGVLTVVAVAAINQNLSPALPGLTGSAPRTAQEQSLTLRTLGSNPYTNTVKIVLDDGSVIALDNYPSNIDKLVETVGSDGTTDLLVESIRSLATQLKDSGEITEEQYNQLQELANDGHRFGILESNILANLGSTENFLYNQFSFENQELTPPVANVHLGFSSVEIKPDGTTEAMAHLIKDNRDLIPYIEKIPYIAQRQSLMQEDIRTNNQIGKDNAIGNVLFRFLKSYQKADQSGALSNPAVQRVVSSLTTNIIQIGDHFQDSLTRAYVDGSDFTPSAINNAVASDLSHTNAAGICTTGGGEDTGIACPRNR